MDCVDVVVVGGGHNGLVAATFLARAGLRTVVVEGKNVVGGAVRTERPFARAPNLGVSTGAYLLGLMPPELIAKLGVDIPVRRRDPHYFLPTTDTRYLLIGSNTDDVRMQMTRFFSERDWHAHVALNEEVAAFRNDIAPTWLAEPLSIEETADRFVRPHLKSVFIDLCRKPISDYLARFDFKSDLLRAMYAVTDGFSGLTATWNTPGTGMNFLIHNMCRLPGSDGTWMIVKGGMGTVTERLVRVAETAGATIRTGDPVVRILQNRGVVEGVELGSGRTVRASTVVCNADPFTMRDLVSKTSFPDDYNRHLESYIRLGTTMKVNLALAELPRFTCLPEDRGQYGPTIHLLPNERDVIRSLTDTFSAVEQGKLPEFPTIEWYIHTTVDPSLRDEHGHHNSALFVQWVPYTLSGTTWDVEESRYVDHLLSVCDRFAPNTSRAVVDVFSLPPPKIEKHFGIRYGHIHHIDNTFGFADRLAYRTPVAGLYSCSAGTHPAGSVIGCAGHNAAMAVLRDLGRSTDL